MTRTDTKKIASCETEKTRKNRKARRMRVLRSIAALLLAVAMVFTSVLTNWPSDLGLFDLWARFDESVEGDMIPDEVHAESW